MSSANQLTTAFSPTQLAELDKVAQECRLTLSGAGNSISGALAVAEQMHKLRSMITPQMLHAVAALQGTPLGFKTDRSRAKTGPKEYSPDELRDVFIEATVRGFSAVGNEFNVIAGNFYGAKAGFERKVRTFLGLSDFQAMYDIEETSGGFAKVQCIATWTLDGEPGEFSRRKGTVGGKPFDNRIRVRVNEGMGYDALLGKAQSKFYRAIYDYLIGAVTATPEGDAEDLVMDASAGKRAKPRDIFDAHAEPVGPSEDGQDAIVDVYRLKLSRIGARNDVSGVSREASKDAALTAAGRAKIAALCNEALRVWPKHIDAGPAPTDADPPFNPPTSAEVAEAENQDAEPPERPNRADDDVPVTLAERKAHLDELAKLKPRADGLRAIESYLNALVVEVNAGDVSKEDQIALGNYAAKLKAQGAAGARQPQRGMLP